MQPIFMLSTDFPTLSALSSPSCVVDVISPTTYCGPAPPHPKAPLSGADSPYQGEMSRRDKRGRDAVSAQPRLRGCRRSAGKDPNRKFSLRFGKEETSTEDKKPCLQGFVPSWSFLTCLRRPYLFSRKRKDRGEKSAWGRGVHPASEFRQDTMFRFGVPHDGHLTGVLVRAA